MDLQVGEKSSPAAAYSENTTSAVQFLNAFMTTALGLLLTIEGLRLARDPGFAIGAAAAGSSLAIGGLGALLGLGWLATLAWTASRRNASG